MERSPFDDPFSCTHGSDFQENFETGVLEWKIRNI